MGRIDRPRADQLEGVLEIDEEMERAPDRFGGFPRERAEAQTEESPGVDRSPLVNAVRARGTVGERVEDGTEGDLHRPVDDEPQAPLRPVLAEHDHGPTEVRVVQEGTGDEEVAAGERLRHGGLRFAVRGCDRARGGGWQDGRGL